MNKNRNTMNMMLIVFITSFMIGLIIWGTIYKIEEYKLQNDDILLQVIEKIKGLHPVINSVVFERGTKSYTINKEKVYLCIYDEDGDPYPMNMLVYVMIHELAHVITKSIGHTEEFHYNFEVLLDQASKMEMYDPNQPLIKNYCGHK